MPSVWVLQPSCVGGRGRGAERPPSRRLFVTQVFVHLRLGFLRLLVIRAEFMFVKLPGRFSG